jgi:hypothetical protein
LFYVTHPASGVVGYGRIETKFRQDRPLWPEEVSADRVIWPLRFEFAVEYCLPPDKWNTSKATSEILKARSRSGFQKIEPQLAIELISNIEARRAARDSQKVGLPVHASESDAPPYKPRMPTPDTGTGTDTEDVSLHEGLQQKLLDIGKLQKYVADKEYTFDLGKLDVVWRRIERSVPTYVFEIQIGGDVYHALAKLKHAYDLWNSHLFLIASEADCNKAKRLLSGIFHEISNRVRLIQPQKIEDLYNRKKAYLDFGKGTRYCTRIK